MIIGLGCIAHDDVLLTGATWDQGKGRILDRIERFGGNVRNALVTVAALGDAPGYLASVGTSDLGQAAIADLVLHGISLEFIERVDGADPVTSLLVIASDGERFIAFDDSTLATTPLPPAERVSAALDSATVLLVDACTAPPGTLEVIAQARRRGIPVVLDAERDAGHEIREYVDAADHVILPATFARELTGAATTAEAGQALWTVGREVVILTDGQAGSRVWTSPHEHVTVSAFDVDVHDTTGCGDSFHGAYAWALERGLDVNTRVVTASAAAAVLAELPSHADRVPTRGRIDDLVRQRLTTGS